MLKLPLMLKLLPKLSLIHKLPKKPPLLKLSMMPKLLKKPLLKLCLMPKLLKKPLLLKLLLLPKLLKTPC